MKKEEKRELIIADNLDDLYIALKLSRYKIVRQIYRFWKTDSIKEDFVRETNKIKTFGNRQFIKKERNK
jgi:hypothetical protein